MTSEQARIERIRDLLAMPSKDIAYGIGDDAAVLEASAGRPVLSVDTAVEGTHFDRAFAAPRTIGRRAVIAAASDLAAMGARPRAALLSLILPSAMKDGDLYELVMGAKDASDELSMPIVGGNLARGSELSITTTVVGEAREVMTRTGARAGDGIYVTGHLGSAALGLAALQRDSTEQLAFFAERWRRPRARVLEGMRLVGVATAAIDLSDGLASDLEHVLRASGVGARLFAESLPFAPGFASGCRALGLDPIELACTGGEDYELLFTAPASETADELATRIGEVVVESGLHVIGQGGGEIRIGAGFDHFRV